MEDYKVKGVPADMTEQAFLQVLRAAQSPVRDAEALAVYSYAVARQLSPAALLAMFHHESTYGRFGSAETTRSWGNTRPPSFGVPDIGITTRLFSVYDNWVDGGVSTVARLFDHKPYQGKNTVREIIPIWAPPTENSTERYIEAVLADIEQWTTSKEPSMTVVSPPIDTSHQSPNRGGYANPHEPRAVCWHITDGVNSLGWLTNPASGASSNYLIRRDGWIYELVPPTESAWANGKVNKPDLSNPVIAQAIKEKRNLNTISISIEHEGKTSAGKGGSLTTQQVDATVALTAWLCARFGIAPDQTHILGHYEIDSVDRANCPGFSAQEWNRWVLLVSTLVGQPPPPVVDNAAVSQRLNERGELIVEVNFGGTATKILGVNYADLGGSVENAAGEQYDRSLQDGVFGPWVQRKG